VNDYVYGVVVISTVLSMACRQPHEPTDEAIRNRRRLGRVPACGRADGGRTYKDEMFFQV